MIDPSNHPEFPPTVHTLLTDAIHRLISADGRMSSFFIGGIEIIPSDEVRSLGAKKTPSLWIYLLDDTESTVNEEGKGLTSGQAWVLATVRAIALFHYGEWNNDRQQLLRRVMGSIQVIIHSQIIIEDEMGQCLSDNIIQTNRIEAIEIKGTVDAFAMTLDFVFGSIIDQVTQLPIGYVLP